MDLMLAPTAKYFTSTVRFVPFQPPPGLARLLPPPTRVPPSWKGRPRVSGTSGTSEVQASALPTDATSSGAPTVRVSVPSTTYTHPRDSGAKLPGVHPRDRPPGAGPGRSGGSHSEARASPQRRPAAHSALAPGAPAGPGAGPSRHTGAGGGMWASPGSSVGPSPPSGRPASPLAFPAHRLARRSGRVSTHGPPPGPPHTPPAPPPPHAPACGQCWWCSMGAGVCYVSMMGNYGQPPLPGAPVSPVAPASPYPAPYAEHYNQWVQSQYAAAASAYSQAYQAMVGQGTPRPGYQGGPGAGGREPMMTGGMYVPPHPGAAGAPPGGPRSPAGGPWGAEEVVVDDDGAVPAPAARGPWGGRGRDAAAGPATPNRERGRRERHRRGPAGADRSPPRPQVLESPPRPQVTDPGGSGASQARVAARRWAQKHARDGSSSLFASSDREGGPPGARGRQAGPPAGPGPGAGAGGPPSEGRAGRDPARPPPKKRVSRGGSLLSNLSGTSDHGGRSNWSGLETPVGRSRGGSQLTPEGTPPGRPKVRGGSSTESGELMRRVQGIEIRFSPGLAPAGTRAGPRAAPRSGAPSKQSSGSSLAVGQHGTRTPPGTPPRPGVAKSPSAPGINLGLLHGAPASEAGGDAAGSGAGKLLGREAVARSTRTIGSEARGTLGNDHASPADCASDGAEDPPVGQESLHMSVERINSMNLDA